jgi:hypothetical protein
MKQVFAKSMVEGAPYGNKNAAGKHEHILVIIREQL